MQLGPCAGMWSMALHYVIWTSVLIIKVFWFLGSKRVYTDMNGTMDKCPDYQGVLITKVS